MPKPQSPSVAFSGGSLVSVSVAAPIHSKPMYEKVKATMMTAHSLK